MEGYSPHFTFEDLTDSRGHPELVPKNRLDAARYTLAGKRLSKLLESIRVLLGNKPIKVNSGYRNVLLNKAVGSIITTSSHTRFEACDIVPTSMKLQEAFDYLLKHKAKLPDLRKVIIEKNAWLHIEVKMSPSEPQRFFTTNDGVHYTPIA